MRAPTHNTSSENYGENDSVWDPENEKELVQADVPAFLAGSLEDATAENIEQDVMEAFSSPEFDLEDNASIAFMAKACQAKVFAQFARSKVKRKKNEG